MPEILRRKATQTNYDAIVVGSGMAGLSSACLLSQQGYKVLVLEANYLPGGCSSSYYRQGYIFESGATTLVGLDEGQPLQYLVEQLGIELPVRRLELPMQVHQNGQVINRYQGLEEWIMEAEKVFGKTGQRPFWEAAYNNSRFVWKNALKQLRFPPSNIGDMLDMVKNVSWDQPINLPKAFISMEQQLQKYGLDSHPDFLRFVNEQLLISAQNHAQQVNVLFGSAALCYTNYTNYYVDGGMLQMILPFVEYLQKQGSELQVRTEVKAIVPVNGHYEVMTGDRTFKAPVVVAAIPVNNVLDLFESKKVQQLFEPKQLPSEQLYSAFQMGIGFRRFRNYESIHHQLILDEPLPQVGADSVFVSFSHPEDKSRAPEGSMVATVSTHIRHPKQANIHDKEAVGKYILNLLDNLNLVKKEQVDYTHTATQHSWLQWTRRKYGFVGGYPQLMHIKPWQMLDARLDGKGAYICGDSTYPGQGIPGVALSGIITANKIMADR